MKKLIAAAFTLAIGSLGGVATAQEMSAPLIQSERPIEPQRGRNTSVLQRERPGYEALGIRAGAFTVTPRVELGVGHTDNVFGTRDNTVSDSFFRADPSVAVRSNWSVHSLTAAAAVHLRRFADQSVLSENGWDVRTDGRYDADADTNLGAGLNARKAYEDRLSGSFPVGAAEAVEFVQLGGYVRGTRAMGRFRGTGTLEYADFNFDAVRTLNGGLLNQDERDRKIGAFNGRVDYGLTPDTSIYTQLVLTRTRYRDDLPGAPLDRSSDEVRALVGASFDLPSLMRGNVAAGYVRQAFTAPQLETLDGLAVDARLEYFPTELLTLTLQARRGIEDSPQGISGGYFSNALSVRADYEFLRNLLFRANVTYERDKFQNLDRRDNIFSIGAGANYFVSRSVGLGAGYVHRHRRSVGTLTGPEFDENLFTLSVVLQR